MSYVLNFKLRGSEKKVFCYAFASHVLVHIGLAGSALPDSTRCLAMSMWMPALCLPHDSIGMKFGRTLFRHDTTLCAALTGIIPLEQIGPAPGRKGAVQLWGSRKAPVGLIWICNGPPSIVASSAVSHASYTSMVCA